MVAGEFFDKISLDMGEKEKMYLEFLEVSKKQECQSRRCGCILVFTKRQSYRKQQTCPKSGSI